MGTRFSDLTPDAQALYNRGKDSLGFLPSISSGYRSPEENRRAGGATHSDHLTGDAFDIPTRNLTRDQQQQVLDYYRAQPGVYVNDERNRPGHGPHIHVSYRGKDGASAAKGDKDDGSAAGKNGKKGDQDGETTKKSDHDKRSKENAPPGKNSHKDIKGKAGSYEKTSTSSIVSRMPTHEPWPGHPKSTEGPRQALQGNDGGSGGGGGGGGGGSNGGSGGSNGSNAASDGRATNPNGDQQKIGEQIYNRLRAKGYSDAFANASVGNFMGEGLNRSGGYGTSIVNDPSGTGKPGRSRGIAQWRNERGTELENFANGNNPSGTKYDGGWRNIDAQVDFYDYELRNKPAYAASNALRNSNNEAQITNTLVDNFERPAERLRPSVKVQRLANANGFRKKRGQKPPTADPGMNKKDVADRSSPAPAPGSQAGGTSTNPKS